MPVKQKGKVTGLKTWEAGFEKVEANMMAGRKRGIIKWGLLVKKRSMQRTPKRIGNLIASAFFVIGTGESDQSGAFLGGNVKEMNNQHDRVLKESRSEAARRTDRRQIVGVVGHSAKYAAIVHELPTAGAAGYSAELSRKKITRGPRKGKRRRAEEVHSRVGGNKFLEKALNGTVREGLAILQRELKIG